MPAFRIRSTPTKFTPPSTKRLELLESQLVSIVSAIRQESEKRTRMVINAIVGKSTGVAAAAGIAGLIAAFGTASTGTAIVSLSGAAATTAQLYWIGSFIGLGVAAGGVILASTGVGVGLGVSILARRRLFGRARIESDFQDHERTIIVSCMTMIKAIREQAASGVEPTDNEMQIISAQVLVPLGDQIDRYWSTESLRAEGILGCHPFNQRLALLPLRKLKRSTTEIAKLAKLMQAPQTQT